MLLFRFRYPLYYYQVAVFIHNVIHALLDLGIFGSSFPDHHMSHFI